jgi:SAM-dependent methyltransferase
MGSTTELDAIDRFIARWAKSSGQERANFQLFAAELSDLLGVPRPDPAQEDGSTNDYTFERTVEFKKPDGTTSPGRIDLYKRGSFVMEAKQSREKGRPKELALAGAPDLFIPDYKPRGQRSANRAWDQLMINARHQAQEYARALPVSHGWPPFVLICDVGHCIEVYADFSGQGKNYSQFPDRQGFRIYLQDLHDEKIRDRLRLIWQDPTALDPTRQSAKVTREIAVRLAAVSKGLEKRGHNPEDVALFLMRCLFTMFAEDVELLPADSFKDLLTKCAADNSKFVPMVEQLWKAMDKGEFAYAIEQQVKRFNGYLFKDAKALPLEREEIGELREAAARNWKEVEPAIFGTLLEQALDEKERARLGAHYTPRSYVERLVVVTVLEPLRQEWAQVQATAERLKEEDRTKDAISVVRKFHDKLCATRVLDPACGTGNFLYVSMELMKRLEGEVLEALVDLGGQETLALEKQTVDPHQFLGMELNPRAAAIAELVIWLGYLQWHFRTKGAAPSEPILRDFKNITVMDAVLTWDGWPVPKVETIEGRRVETLPNARRPDWPEAEFIVGNPPFVAGQNFRSEFGDAYAEALWRVYDGMSGGSDLVMYWWDRAAELVAKGSAVRFGFVTTNSITQVFNRRVVAQHLSAKRPVSLLMAIPDHPWTKATVGAAAVRIAMTVGSAGHHDGALREVVSEGALDTDLPDVRLTTKIGRINADLTVGVDVTQAVALHASDGICSDGVKLHGKGFIVAHSEALLLGLDKRQGLDQFIRPYRNGRDLAAIPRGVMVIDLFGLTAEEARQRFPEVYQHLLQTVKPERDRNRRASYRDYWWVFGEPRRELRPALLSQSRYIATVDTAEHRVFQFLNANIVCDDKVVVIASADAFHLGVLSSQVHLAWVIAQRTRLGQGNDVVYVKSRCFDPFPFPDCAEPMKVRIRAVAEELDAHRKACQAEHSRLTLTQMYNVLEKLRSGEALDADDERIKTEGLVLILKELHDKLDALVFEAYGWPATLTEEDILARLVALNKERAAEERAGTIRWLRPDYQIPRFGSDAERARLEEERRKARDEAKAAARQGTLDIEDDLQEMKPKFPTGNELAETAAVMQVLGNAEAPLPVAAICSTFSQGRQIEKRVQATVLALARLGHLASTDGGETFSLRRIA